MTLTSTLFGLFAVAEAVGVLATTGTAGALVEDREPTTATVAVAITTNAPTKDASTTTSLEFARARLLEGESRDTGCAVTNSDTAPP